MIVLKSDRELNMTFQRLVQMMDVPVEWNGLFLIIGDYLILQGDVRSLFFNFDTKSVVTNIIDLQTDKEEIVPIEQYPQVKDVLHMVLYVFGKWGNIKGLRVEKDYAQLNRLFAQILGAFQVEAQYSGEHFRFYRNKIRLTYEDVLELVLAEDGEEPMREEEETQGLWHKLVWKKSASVFLMKDITVAERRKNRIGNNFYLAGYLCPKCGNKLYMAVYPEGKEFRIETEEGDVLMARAYTCRNCCCFYTPRPQSLLIDGDVYRMDFERDETAYTDYLELLGRTAGRVVNTNYNEFADKRKRYNESNAADAGEPSAEMVLECLPELSEAELFRTMRKMADGFYSDDNVEKLERAINSMTETVPEYEKKAVFMKRAVRDAQKKERGYTEFSAEGQSAWEEARETEKKKNRAEEKRTERNHTEENSTEGNHTEGNCTEPAQNRAESRKDKPAGFKPGKSDVKIVSHPVEKQSKKTSMQERKRQGAWEEARKTEKGKNRAEENRTEENSTEENSTEENRTEGNRTEPAQNRVESRKDKTAGFEPGEPDTKVSSYPEKKQSEKTAVQEGKRQSAGVRARKTEKGKNRADRNVTEENGTEENGTEENSTKPAQGHTKSRKNKTAEYEAEKTAAQKRQEDFKKLANVQRLVNKPGRRTREECLSLKEELLAQDMETDLLQPYIDRLDGQIRALDEKRISAICPDAGAMDFEDAMEAYKEIESGDFLPNLKYDALKELEKRMSKIKTDECEQLVHKLETAMEDAKIKRSSRYHFYPAKKVFRKKNTPEEIKEIENALESYASGIGKFEYPVFVFDKSKEESGQEGFLLTPEKIYYSAWLNSYYIPIMSVQKIEALTGLLNRGIYVYQKNGTRTKLPAAGETEELEKFAKVLQEFVFYLQERPFSRKESYLVKEKHDTICCYRCGYVYKGANICPRCGYKQNE